MILVFGMEHEDSICGRTSELRLHVGSNIVPTVPTTLYVRLVDISVVVSEAYWVTDSIM